MPVEVPPSEAPASEPVESPEAQIFVLALKAHAAPSIGGTGPVAPRPTPVRRGTVRRNVSAPARRSRAAVPAAPPTTHPAHCRSLKWNAVTQSLHNPAHPRMRRRTSTPAVRPAAAAEIGARKKVARGADRRPLKLERARGPRPSCLPRLTETYKGGETMGRGGGMRCAPLVPAGARRRVVGGSLPLTDQLTEHKCSVP